MEDLHYVKNFHTPIFGNEKPSNISDDGRNLLHRQVCGCIRMWIDDNVLNQIIGRQMLGLCGLSLNNYMLEKLRIARCF